MENLKESQLEEKLKPSFTKEIMDWLLIKLIRISKTAGYRLAGKFLKVLLLILVSLVFIYLFIFTLTPITERTIFNNSLVDFHPDSGYYAGKKPADAYLKKIQQEMESSERKMKRLLPGRDYLIINTIENKIFLYSRNKLIHEGVCSTGSYILLKAGADQQWIFQTPKGMFSIKGKISSPVWRKPDWAFIEEGLPVPPANSHLRFEAGVLGDYALSLGDGYLIHGTLYQRFLGLPVTHGCVRLGDEDLEKVYRAMHIGSKVYIF
jgi:hypothetical protein